MPVDNEPLASNAMAIKLREMQRGTICTVSPLEAAAEIERLERDIDLLKAVSRADARSTLEPAHEPDGYIRYSSWNPSGDDPEQVFTYEFASREEPHEGEGWVPLYARASDAPTEPTCLLAAARAVVQAVERTHDPQGWFEALALLKSEVGRRPSPPPPAEQAGCEYSDDGEHECKHCDAKHVTQTAGRFIESIWEVTDDCEENAQTGDVTMDQASWQKIMQAIWDLGGRHRERLSNFGYSPPTKEV